MITTTNGNFAKTTNTTVTDLLRIIAYTYFPFSMYSYVYNKHIHNNMYVYATHGVLLNLYILCIHISI